MALIAPFAASAGRYAAGSFVLSPCTDPLPDLSPSRVLELTFSDGRRETRKIASSTPCDEEQCQSGVNTLEGKKGTIAEESWLVLPGS